MQWTPLHLRWRVKNKKNNKKSDKQKREAYTI